MSLTVKEVLKFVIVFLLLLLYKLKKIPKILNHNDKSRNFCLISANLNGPKGSSLEVTCCKICSAKNYAGLSIYADDKEDGLEYPKMVREYSARMQKLKETGVV